MGWLSRFELPTSRATIWRSNQLNYSHHISYLPYHMDYSSLRPPSIHLVPLQPFPRYDTNLAGRSYIRCHYSLIFVPQMVLRVDVTSRSHLILADYPGASDGNRTHAYCLASSRTSRYTTPAFGISVASTGPVCLCLTFLTYSQYLRVSTAKELFYLCWHMEPTTESGAE